MAKVNSRAKGRNGEYLVRDYFRERGWSSDRVPGSGAFNYRTKDTDLKGDVVIRKGGIELKAEVKFKREEYKGVYALMGNEKQLGLKIGDALIHLSFDFDDLGFVEAPGSVQFMHVATPTRTHKKLAGMVKLLKGADFLVIKINRKPLLFIRYW